MALGSHTPPPWHPDRPDKHVGVGRGQAGHQLCKGAPLNARCGNAYGLCRDVVAGEDLPGEPSRAKGSSGVSGLRAAFPLMIPLLRICGCALGAARREPSQLQERGCPCMPPPRCLTEWHLARPQRRERVRMGPPVGARSVLLTLCYF